MNKSLATSNKISNKITNTAIATGAIVLASLLSACGNTAADNADAAAAPVATEAPIATDAPVTEAPVDEAPVTEAPTATTAPATPATTAPATPAPAPTASTNNGPCPTYTVDNSFPVGLCAKGDLVTEIQRALRYVIEATTVDGYYGPETQTTVRSLQFSFGLPETGIVDDATYQSILAAGYDYDDEEEGTDWHDENSWNDLPDNDGMNAGHDPEYYENYTNNVPDNDGMNAGHDPEYYENNNGADWNDSGWENQYEEYCNFVLAQATNDPGNADIIPTEVEMCIDAFSI